MKTFSRSSLLLAAAIAAAAGALAWTMMGETPAGRMRGMLIAADSGRPLPHVRLTLHPPGPPYDEARWYAGLTGPDGSFSFPGVAAGEYKLEAFTRAHKNPPTEFVVEEGKTLTQDVELQPGDPSIEIFEGDRVFTSDEVPELRIRGFVPREEVEVSVYRLAPDTAVNQWRGWFPGARGSIRGASPDSRKDLALVSRTRVPIANTRDVEGVFRRDVRLGALTAGVYLVQVQGAPAVARTLVAISDLGIVVKHAKGQARVYACELRTGQPVAGASLEVLAGDARLDAGATDANGLATLKAVQPEGVDQVTVVAGKGGSLAVATYYSSRQPSAGVRCYTVTDRPAYRPGDTVHLKSILRTLSGGGFAVPTSGEVTVTVRDGGENTVHRASLKPDTMGGVADTLQLDPAAMPGYYTVATSYEGVTSEAGFQVAAYRKPEFSVTVTPASTRVAAGEKVRATVTATYYFGAPVPGARVNMSVTRDMAWYGWSDPWDSDDDTTETGLSQYGEESWGGEEYLTDFSGVTDAQGRFEVVVPTSRPDPSDAGDYFYTITANVVDSADRQQDGSVTVTAAQGRFRLQTSLDAYVSPPGSPLSASVTVLDYDGKSVPNVSGRAELFRRQWVGNRERREKVADALWKSGAEGAASFAVTPDKAGDYVLAVSAEDADGRRVYAYEYPWVMGREGATFAYPYGGLDVRLDRSRYDVGDVAELVVNTKHAPQKALLTLEGGDIVESRVVDLPSRTSVLRIPVRQAMMPAVRVTLCFFREKNYRGAEAILNVSRAPRALQVQVTPDKPVHLPGERITWAVRTLRPDGRPVPAQVTLGVVDQALYALYPDASRNITAAFYPRELDAVGTAWSEERIYLSGDDKSGPGMAIRRRFEDTAYWNPSIVTGADGRATVSFTLPDNLTTWRATARAITADTLAGQTLQTVLVQKPHLVRLQPPRFLTQGDRAELLASASNLTQTPSSGSVGLDSDAFTLEGSAGRDVKIRPSGTETVGWWITAVRPGPATVKTWLSGDRLSDAMETTLDVRAKGRTLRDGAFLVAAPKASATMSIRDDAVPGASSLTLRLSPTLLTSLLGAMDYLANYPYGCTEQTVSSFLPDLVLVELAKKEGIADEAYRRRVDAMVRSGILRLVGSRREGGGWGWWSYDTPDPWMTAYATFALISARKAGYDVLPDVIDGALSATSTGAAQVTTPHDTRAFAAWVLALGGRAEADQVLADFNGQALWRRQHLSDWGAAMLAMAFAERGATADAQAVMRVLWSHVTPTAYTPVVSRKSWYSPADYASAVLLAACRVTPNDARLPDLARRLLSLRQGERWNSTRDTAFSAMALTRFAEQTGELSPAMDCSVRLNGRVVARESFRPRDLAAPERIVRVPAGDLRPGPAVLEVTCVGRGRAYVSATLEQVASSGLSRPVYSPAGLSVERRYRKAAPSRFGNTPLTGGGRTETAFRSGDIVEVTLTVRSSQPFDYVMVEDPLPAGFEPQDRGTVESWEWGYWWCAEIVRDDRVGFALRELEPGAKTIKYRVRARTRGTFTALPPTVFDMYNPGARGEGAATEVRVR